MPLYTFYNKQTGEVFDELLSMSAKEQFLLDNPMIESYIMAPAIVSGVSLTNKIPSGFKEVLSKVAEKHPNSAVADNLGGRGIKEARVREVVDKHVKKITKRLDG
jgi:hypothetical protein